MFANDGLIQFLLTLPPGIAGRFESLENRKRPEWFACSDSSGPSLGSGGGTANLLIEAWRSTGDGKDFSTWLNDSRKLILHSGGQSRRLPAYAPMGKLLMPVPVFRWSRGQRLDQTLLDLQLPGFTSVLNHGGPKSRMMLVSGDTLIRLPNILPPFPDVDLLGLGMWGTPEKARDFGVFFTPRNKPNELSFFLQKPSPARIRELAEEYLYLFDTGMWLLSERAVNVLMKRCGWNENASQFDGGRCGSYEFYHRFGLAVGTKPVEHDELVQSLSCAVVPLPDAEFYHFGTSAQMIESVSELQNLVLDETKLGSFAGRRHPDQYLQNTRFSSPLRREENHTLWVENSVVPASWKLAHEHVLTGVPENNWDLRLEPGVCLDFVPVGETDLCVRPYGFRDSFSGKLCDANTKWLGRPVAGWFAAHGLKPDECGLDENEDIQFSAIFPVLPQAKIDPRFIEWLFAAQPVSRPDFAKLWRETPRHSGRTLCELTNFKRLYAGREALRHVSLAPLMRNFRWSVFYRLDLESTARIFAASDVVLPEVAIVANDEPLAMVHDQMFRSAVMRHRKQSGWEVFEANAFGRLRELIVHEAQLSPALPRCNVLEDQIVWARSPVRLDLAGGWTDTPPYCIEFGGRVLNVAVDINGQPPIQVFAKRSEKNEIIIRSIDLGVEERVRTYADLEAQAHPGSPFALARAAFALAGFLPRFHTNGGFSSLDAQLADFGSGIELSLLSAVPKGSGLGTSSILSTTVLAALSELCGLNWDRSVLFTRTLALEQLLTTGGGWQDQAGGLYRGIKMIETGPGLSQKPTLRWLPDHLFGHEFANHRVLLYYTGVTRLAKNILAEIVRGIFLNSPSHLGLIGRIGDNAEAASTAVQKCDYDLLTEAIRERWRLTQMLDVGTNPPAIQAILNSVKEHLAAAKLLGAGGGGYLLMFAKDEAAAARIRHQLTTNPPNPRARFVSFSLSDTGLQVTRS
ncbi:MAG: bifunctional fucokinase/L-fucose-1-P-guanylyltransferase [Verrucomicrobia bacterium]|nr:bifunctional fucokinase/L-fucose-1-P-guanylyltransferase [Verrucomicrobiota bacterium]